MVVYGFSLYLGLIAGQSVMRVILNLFGLCLETFDSLGADVAIFISCLFDLGSPQR